jgi:hypothetical protein
MNGRIYDPVLGRFLSADPNVDGTYDSQGYNRYSYVGNNPMNRTDPSGYRSLGDVFKQAFFLGPHILSDPMYWASPKTFNQYYGQAAGIGVTAVVSYFCGPVVGGAAGGFVSGFSSSLLNGGSVGDAFKSGVIGGGIGAVKGAVTAGIGEAFGPVGSNIGRELGRAAAHGVVGGLFEEAMGGDSRHGFLAGFAGSLGGSLAPNIPGVPGYGDRSFSAIGMRTTIAAVVGGTASVLGGGKFANGAVTAAFQHLLNAEGANLLRPKYVSRLEISASIPEEGDPGISKGHAYITVTDLATGEKHTYATWDDSSRAGQDGRVVPGSDVRIDLEKTLYPPSLKLATMSASFDLTAGQNERLKAFINTPVKWSRIDSCAGWSSKAVYIATGVSINASESVMFFTVNSPRRLFVSLHGMENKK